MDQFANLKKGSKIADKGADMMTRLVLQTTKTKIRPNTTNITDTTTSTDDSPAVDTTDNSTNNITNDTTAPLTTLIKEEPNPEHITDMDTPIIEEDSTNLQSFIKIPINTDDEFIATTTTTEEEEEEEEVGTTSEENRVPPLLLE